MKRQVQEQQQQNKTKKPEWAGLCFIHPDSHLVCSTAHGNALSALASIRIPKSDSLPSSMLLTVLLSCNISKNVSLSICHQWRNQGLERLSGLRKIIWRASSRT